MKRLTLSIIIIIGLVIIFSQPTIFNAFLALLFLGIVPGTNIQIPFWVMLLVMLGAGYILIRWLGSQPLYIGNLAEQEKTARQLARKNVAKKIRKPTKSTAKTTVKRSRKSPKKRSIRRLA